MAGLRPGLPVPGGLGCTATPMAESVAAAKGGGGLMLDLLSACVFPAMGLLSGQRGAYSLSAEVPGGLRVTAVSGKNAHEGIS